MEYQGQGRTPQDRIPRNGQPQDGRPDGYPQPAPYEAMVRVHRIPGHHGAMVQFTVRIDGSPVERLHPNETAHIRVPPGEHRVEVTTRTMHHSRTLYFTARPGDDISFSCHHAPSHTLHDMLHPVVLERDDGSAAVAAYQAAAFGMDPNATGGFPGPDALSGRPGGKELPRVIGMRETGQFEESLGEEVRTIDNRRSPTAVSRSVRASRDWTRNLQVGEDHKRKYGAEAGADLHFVEIKGRVEAEVKRNYAIEVGTTHSFEEEFHIEVPQRTALRVILHWKRIWQRGVVRLAGPDGTEIEVPYQVVVNVTFDQVVQDAPDLWTAEAG